MVEAKKSEEELKDGGKKSEKYEHKCDIKFKSKAH